PATPRGPSRSATICLDEEGVRALLAHRVPAMERPAIDAHLAECPSCRALLASQLPASLPAETPADVSVAAQELGGWDRYELLKLLGTGGMGTVYEARDRQLGRVVALKFIRGPEPRLTLRLKQEARAQARIDHPNICKVFEVGEVNGRAYIAMQLVH